MSAWLRREQIGTREKCLVLLLLALVLASRRVMLNACCLSLMESLGTAGRVLGNHARSVGS